MRTSWTSIALLALPLLHARAEGPVTLSLDPMLLVAAAEPAATKPAPADPAEKADPPAASSYGITGNWWGARDTLRDHSVYFGGYVFFDLSKTLRAGLDTNAWSTSYLLDLHVTADMERALGWTGGTAFLDFQSHDQSRNGDTAVGDIQVFDNITAPRFVQIAQLWYRQALGSSFRFKIGKIDISTDAAKPDDDANDAFTMIEHGQDFIQSADAVSPSFSPAASYPTPGTGAELFYSQGGFYVGAGALYSNSRMTFLDIAGHPETTLPTRGGMLGVGEVGDRWVLGELPGHTAVGGWLHSGEFPRVSGGGTVHGSGGAYALFDQSILHEEKDGEVARDLGMFLLAGIADKAAVPTDQHLALGVSAKGFVPGRPDDSIGAMGSWVHLSAQPALVHPFELATEAYYKMQITPWASLKPSFAYIASPGGRHPDAAVVTIRAEIDF